MGQMADLPFHAAPVLEAGQPVCQDAVRRKGYVDVDHAGGHRIAEQRCRDKKRFQDAADDHERRIDTQSKEKMTPFQRQFLRCTAEGQKGCGKAVKSRRDQENNAGCIRQAAVRIGDMTVPCKIKNHHDQTADKSRKGTENPVSLSPAERIVFIGNDKDKEGIAVQAQGDAENKIHDRRPPLDVTEKARVSMGPDGVNPIVENRHDQGCPEPPARDSRISDPSVHDQKQHQHQRAENLRETIIHRKTRKHVKLLREPAMGTRTLADTKTRFVFCILYHPKKDDEIVITNFITVKLYVPPDFCACHLYQVQLAR